MVIFLQGYQTSWQCCCTWYNGFDDCESNTHVVEKLGQSAHKVLQPRPLAYVYVSDVIAYLDDLKVESFDIAFFHKQTVIEHNKQSYYLDDRFRQETILVVVCCSFRFFRHVESKVIRVSHNTRLF